MVSSGMLSKLWAKDLVKKASGVDAQACHASLRPHTQAYHSISSTHTGAGTAKRLAFFSGSQIVVQQVTSLPVPAVAGTPLHRAEGRP